MSTADLIALSRQLVPPERIVEPRKEEWLVRHLADALERAELDAKRYRWLRRNCQYGFENHDGPQLIHRNGETGPHQNAEWREDLDAAIDAYLAKERRRG